jgi:hypothetical protein
LPELGIIASGNQVTALTFQTKKAQQTNQCEGYWQPDPRPTPRPILKDPEFAEGVADVVAGWDDMLPNDDELVLTADVEIDIGFRIIVPTGTILQADFEQQSAAPGSQQQFVLPPLFQLWL